MISLHFRKKRGQNIGVFSWCLRVASHSCVFAVVAPEILKIGVFFVWRIVPRKATSVAPIDAQSLNDAKLTLIDAIPFRKS